MFSVMKKKIIVLLIFCVYPLAFARWPFDIFEHKKPFSVIIEAGGDAAHPGRTIGTHFENAINFTIAQHLKESLDGLRMRARIFINRTPTEIIAPLQNAQFSNKLSTDLYISINCYPHTKSNPQITLYQFSYNDPIVLKKDGIGFHTADKIYLINQPQTCHWASELKKIFSEQSQIEIAGVYAMPYKPLIGIEASALGMEIGLSSDTQLPLIIETIKTALEQFLKRKIA
jgi:hypothetical protein